VVIDEEAHTVHVIAEADQLSLAIGKKGQNARLTAKLAGWKIDIQRDEADVSFDEKVARAVAQLAKVEGIGAELAGKLVHAGFLTPEGILAVELSDLQGIEGFTEEIAKQVHAAAEVAFEREHGKAEETTSDT
jgi:N utilization substance protein A